MKDNKKTTDSAVADRMGRFIGQLRDYEGVSLQQLAHGLCSIPHLNRIENGEREIGKQLTDTFFQRLGKPAELFERILDWDEFQQWQKRQEIITYLNNGNIAAARTSAAEYGATTAEVLDQQFHAIVELDCCALEGATPTQLLPMVNAALKLTQPTFEIDPIDTLLLSRNEGRLFFAHLKLREELEGLDTVAQEYHALWRYFFNRRYESRERVYILPYIALRMIENDYASGCFSSALTLCENTLEELTKEYRLYAYAELLEWKQRLHDAMGNPDRTPEKLLSHLSSLLEYAPEQVSLLVPCEELGNVYCLNHVIRDRRKLLGISQEDLSDGICAPHTMSRIENHGGKIQRKKRRLLLQRVNMSGERYDYEVITDRYEDYLLRSELDRATTAEDWNRSHSLLTILWERCADTPTNRQYFLKKEAIIRLSLKEGHPEKISREEFAKLLEDALHITLPLDIDKIDTYPACTLSINEILGLLPLASCYEKLRMYQKCLAVHLFLRRCLESTGADTSLYVDLFTYVEIGIASVLGSLGNPEESSNIIHKCLNLMVQNQRSEVLARCLLGEAWNIADRLGKLQPESRSIEEQKVDTKFRQAYAAAIISGDVVRQRLIPKYYYKQFNKDFQL